ncbi:MAG: cysteine--tRNA ligase [Patescibacteria group bacterium]|nr:cysteine--tRNA ligase [Patescibacteria group bacterium]
MEIKLTNTLTRKKEIFAPIKENEVGIYTCGPTVYNYAHIGNLRAYVFADILKRALKFNGYEVKQIINITDVGHLTSDEDFGEDKLEKGAEREKKSVWEVAEFYTKAFFLDLEKLNILPAQNYPKATDHIKEMIDFIKVLDGKGYTYLAGGNVYFDTSKLKDYGKMAELKLAPEELKSRIEIDPNKKSPFDFVLWFTKYKYKSHVMEWDSPWGKGFPGWHIECSAMATKYFGKHFDIHTGGIDHIPVHHTNEIAQSEAAFGHKWVNYWLHNNFLVLKDSDKMSKSSGQFLRLQTLIDEGFDPLDYRYYLLGGHYRAAMTFSTEALQGARNSLKRIREKMTELRKRRHPELDSGSISRDSGSQATVRNDITDNMKKYESEFQGAINDDLNTSVALSVMWKTLDAEDLNPAEKIELMKKYDKVLGLDLLEVEKIDIPKEVVELVEKRLKARNEKNWSESDRLREEISAKGYEILDTKEGFEIKKK